LAAAVTGLSLTIAVAAAVPAGAQSDEPSPADTIQPPTPTGPIPHNPEPIDTQPIGTMPPGQPVVEEPPLTQPPNLNPDLGGTGTAEVRLLGAVDLGDPNYVSPPDLGDPSANGQDEPPELDS
jgi:hypothetical protein